MTRKEYCDQVLANLRRLTVEEQEAVRAELDAHMEDHICDLLDLGYDAALAEERTMALMGDPVEVGRELDKQYPLRWLVLGRIAFMLTFLMCLVALLGVGVLSHFLWSLEARFSPDEINSDRIQVEAVIRPNVKMTVGNDILKVYRVSVGTREGEPVAELAMCAYDRIPGGIVSEVIYSNLTLENQQGEQPDHLWTGGGGKGNFGADFCNRYVPIEPGDTYVTVTYDRFGEAVSMRVPLPEEVAP